jgi:two-component system CheB/CheR fusion protein
MESLVGVVQALSRARDVDSIIAIVRDAARSLTGADGASFVLRDGDQCHYVDENAIGPLWKGKRFPLSACVSGWAMLNARPAVIEDIYNDPRVPADAYRPTFVKSLAMVPIRRSAPIGAIGNYWAVRRLPTEDEVAVLQALADTTSVALENADLYGELQQKVVTLEEQRTRINEQRDALEVFTRALAHDLKEPVRSIRSFSEIIARGSASQEKTQQYFKYIQNAGERMGMLVDSVFRYTLLDDPAAMPKESCRTTDLWTAAKIDLDGLIRDKSVTIWGGDELPTVSANPRYLTHVLTHLLTNAVRHGGNGVNVHIFAEEKADRWQITVEDDGPGIAAEQLEAIFLPFKRLTRNEECAGLGLAICRKILACHGGSIWCESSPGKARAFPSRCQRRKCRRPKSRKPPLPPHLPPRRRQPKAPTCCWSTTLRIISNSPGSWCSSRPASFAI